MQLRYRVTLEDYREAHKLMCGLVRSPLTKVMRWTGTALFTAVMIGTLLYEYSRVPGSPEDRTFGLIVMVAVAVIALSAALRWFSARSVDRAYARDPVWQREFTADFDDQAVSFDDGLGATSSDVEPLQQLR
jgi:hypothetical protein